MARLVILASFFTGGVYAVRVIHTSAEHESQAVVHASDLVPGQLLPWSPSAAMTGVPAVSAWNASVRLNMHGGRAVFPLMSFPMMPRGESEYLSSVQSFYATGWKSEPDVWDPDDQQYKKRDAKGKWRDKRGRFTKAPVSPIPASEHRLIAGPVSDTRSPDLPPSSSPSSGLYRLSSRPGSWHADLAQNDLPSTVEFEDDQMSGSTDPSDPESYDLNLVEAFETLKRDIPQGLLLERDSQRLAPTNWDIYSDSLETVFKVDDTVALRLLGAVIPSWNSNVKGLRSNQRVLKELRTLVETLRLAKVLESAAVTESTHMGRDPSTGEEFVESRWITKLVMKQLQIPEWLPAEPTGLPPIGSRWTNWKPQCNVNIEGVSRFYLNAEGKIHRHSIDEFNLIVENDSVDLQQLNEFLGQLIRYWPDYGKNSRAKH